MGGIGFYHKLKKSKDTYKIPFIFLTGYDQQKLSQELKEDDFIIPKPINWKQFMVQIEGCFKKVEFKKQLNKSQKTSQKGVSKKSVSIDDKKEAPKNKPVKPAQSKTAQFQNKRTSQVQSTKTGTKSTSKKLKPKQVKSDAKIIKELKINKDKIAKKKRKAKPVLPSLPPGRSTQHFSDPIGTFDSKTISDTTSTIFRTLKSGNYQSPKHIEFSRLKLESSNLRESLKIGQGNTFGSMEDVDELLVDFDVDGNMFIDEEDEDLSKYDDLLIELDEDFESAETSEDDFEDSEDEVNPEEELVPAKQVQPGEELVPAEMDSQKKIDIDLTQKVQEKIPEYKMVEQSLYVSSYIDSENEFSEKEKFNEVCHDIFSMAGLCFQMLGEDFDIYYVLVENEQENILFLNEDDNYEIGIISEIPDKK